MSCHGFYLHIPFCEQKCPYCDFYSVRAQETLMDAYTQSVLRGLTHQPFGKQRLDTIYFGGGTPSALGGKRLGQLLDGIGKAFVIADDAEITVECNPHSSLPQTLHQLRGAGFNRISLGMQSAQDAQLQVLGRLHSVQDVTTAVQSAQQAGFERISLDLMLATPHQTLGDIDAAIGLCDRLGVEHVSAYLLKIEDGTPFALNQVQDNCPDEDMQAMAYEHAVHLLAKFGYVQYEISNFARNGQVSRHNMTYWDCREYIGFGPSAHGFVHGMRYYFPRDLQGFLGAENPFDLSVADGAGGDAEEYLMLRARLTEGIVFARLAERYPQYDLDALRLRALKLARHGLVEANASGFRLTLQGFLLSNAVIGELIGTD